MTALKIFVSTAVFGSLAALLFAQRSVSAFPDFEIKIVTTMTGGTKTVEPITRVHFGRSDGSRGVRTTEVYGGRPCTTTTVWDMARRQEVTTSDCVAMKNTLPTDGVPRHVSRSAVASCAVGLGDFRLTGTDQIGGISVERFENNAATHDSTVYMAPSLGCLTLKALHYWKDSTGHVTGTTSDEPLDVRIDWYDATLFSVPANYHEVLPSERRNAMSRYFSGTAEAASCLRRGNEREDERYEAAKKHVAHTNISNWSIIANMFRRSSAVNDDTTQSGSAH